MPRKNEERLMTGEELARHPELQPCELVNGRVVPVTLTEFGHGRLALLVHRAGVQPETFGIGDTLRDEEILPGFSLPLAELFQG